MGREGCVFFQDQILLQLQGDLKGSVGGTPTSTKLQRMNHYPSVTFLGGTIRTKVKIKQGNNLHNGEDQW